MAFTHLHVHTEYSLLDGMCRVKDVLEKAKNLGMTSLAVTDHGAKYGAFKFFVKAQEIGVKPIIGVEVYKAKNSRLDKQAGIDRDRFHLVLLAKDLEGYRNLMKLVSIAHLEGFYYSRAWILKSSEIQQRRHRPFGMSRRRDPQAILITRTGKRKNSWKRIWTFTRRIFI
jgi:DNA polymerase III alpha subunit